MVWTVSIVEVHINFIVFYILCNQRWVILDGCNLQDFMDEETDQYSDGRFSDISVSSISSHCK